MSHANEGAGASGETGDVSAGELAAVLGTPGAPVLVDVREPDEFDAWAIPGARNVPLCFLGHQLASIGRDRRVVVVCASGKRSADAVGMLRDAGIDAASLAGGMLAWAEVFDTASLEVGSFSVVQLRRRGKGCLSYVVSSGRDALVVDPPWDIDRPLAVASARGWTVRHVVDTHLHADHVSGARALAAATHATLHLSARDPYRYRFSALADGDRLDLGLGAVRVLATPGHTPGSVVLDLEAQALLTGDTLFVDGVGRPDLADRAVEYAGALYESLAALLAGRGDEVFVLPAHFGSAVSVVPDVVVASRLGNVRSALSQLGWDRERFVSWASTRATPRPPSDAEIVRLNSGGLAISTREVRTLELGPNRCSAA